MEQVMVDIDNDRPLYMRMRRPVNSKGYAYHALVLRGYYWNDSTDYMQYYVMNPWGEYDILSASGDGSTVVWVTGSRTYTWIAEIYNIH
jgi:hypothetical protein